MCLDFSSLKMFEVYLYYVQIEFSVVFTTACGQKTSHLENKPEETCFFLFSPPLVIIAYVCKKNKPVLTTGKW